MNCYRLFSVRRRVVVSSRRRRNSTVILLGGDHFSWNVSARTASQTANGAKPNVCRVTHARAPRRRQWPHGIASGDFSLARRAPRDQPVPMRRSTRAQPPLREGPRRARPRSHSVRNNRLCRGGGRRVRAVFNQYSTRARLRERRISST